MLKTGQSYADAGEHYYEAKYRDQVLKALYKKAASFGFPTHSGNRLGYPCFLEGSLS